jgi:hypothetical protein
VISFTKGYTTPKGFGAYGATVLPSDSTLPPTVDVSPGVARTIEDAALNSSAAVAAATQANPNLLWDPNNPVPAVERVVLYLGVPTLAFAAVTGKGLTRWLLGALGVGLVYLHVNGSLAQND